MSHILCAQLIALNYLLYKFPETRSQKRTSQPTSSNKQYKLPFSTERDLVEILSYLSKIRDGSDYIPAVCVEQDRAGNHLKVLLAVNKCTWNDGDDILRSIKARFEDIFDILRNAEFHRTYVFSSTLPYFVLILFRAWEIHRNQRGNPWINRCNVLPENSLSVTSSSKQKKRD